MTEKKKVVVTELRDLLKDPEVLRRVASACEYNVEEGDDLDALCKVARVEVEKVNALNGGREPDEYFVVGNTVRLPRKICLLLEAREE